MPFFGTEYETDRTPEKMSFEAIFDNGERLLITPHLCAAHHDSPHREPEDHRGYIDLTTLSFSGPHGALIPSTMMMSLDFASALCEGLMEVAPWAQLNLEANEK
jgi:hypothetical protein